MTTGIVWDERFAWHDAGLASTNPWYAPFCGLAVIEAMAGEKTKVVDPMLGWYAALPGQELQAHQVKAIDEAAAVVRSHWSRRPQAVKPSSWP